MTKPGRIWFDPRSRLWRGYAYEGRLITMGSSVASVYETLLRQYYSLLHRYPYGGRHGL